MTDDHTLALRTTYGITVTLIRRNPPASRYLAEHGPTRAHGATEAEAVTRCVAALRGP